MVKYVTIGKVNLLVKQGYTTGKTLLNSNS